jgi:hypothetical protein
MDGWMDGGVFNLPQSIRMAIIDHIYGKRTVGIHKHSKRNSRRVVSSFRYLYNTWVYYVISDAPPIFMKIVNLMYFRVLSTNIITIFGAKADLTPILTKNRRWWVISKASY